jgi:hypothetical protein
MQDRTALRTGRNAIPILPSGSISGTPEKVPILPKYLVETKWNRMPAPAFRGWAEFQVFDFAASPAVPC